MLMKSHHPKTVLSAAFISTILACGGVDAATILLSDDFETNLGNWSANGANATYYSYSTGTNYASTGNGAARISGPGGAELGPSYIQLTSALAVSSGGYTDLTISFNDKFQNGSTTRRPSVSYSVDGGSNWVFLGSWDSGESGADNVLRSSSIALTPGSAPVFTGSWNTKSTANVLSFTDNVTFRLGAMGSNTGHFVYFDDIVISSSIPEPHTALMGSLGLLLLLRRRRSA